MKNPCKQYQALLYRITLHCRERRWLKTQSWHRKRRRRQIRRISRAHFPSPSLCNNRHFLFLFDSTMNEVLIRDKARIPSTNLDQKLRSFGSPLGLSLAQATNTLLQYQYSNVNSVIWRVRQERSETRACVHSARRDFFPDSRRYTATSTLFSTGVAASAAKGAVEEARPIRARSPAQRPSTGPRRRSFPAPPGTGRTRRRTSWCRSRRSQNR